MDKAMKVVAEAVRAETLLYSALSGQNPDGNFQKIHSYLTTVHDDLESFISEVLDSGKLPGEEIELG